MSLTVLHVQGRYKVKNASCPAVGNNWLIEKREGKIIKS